MPRPDEEYVSDWMVEQSRRKGLPPEARSEPPVITDGQLGDSLERGPERINPEGSVDISNEDYREH